MDKIITGVPISEELPAGPHADAAYVGEGPGGMEVIIKRSDSIPVSNLLDRAQKNTPKRNPSLNHPALVTPLGAGPATQQGGACIIYPRIKGVKLSEAQLTPGEGVQIIVQLAEAVENLHHQGQIHGGIAAHQVILDADGKPHLTDVGWLWDGTGRYPASASEDVKGLAQIAQTIPLTPQVKEMVSTPRPTIAAFFNALRTGRDLDERFTPEPVEAPVPAPSTPASVAAPIPTPVPISQDEPEGHVESEQKPVEPKEETAAPETVASAPQSPASAPMERSELESEPVEAPAPERDSASVDDSAEDAYVSASPVPFIAPATDSESESEPVEPVSEPESDSTSVPVELESQPEPELVEISARHRASESVSEPEHEAPTDPVQEPKQEQESAPVVQEEQPPALGEASAPTLAAPVESTSAPVWNRAPEQDQEPESVSTSEQSLEHVEPASESVQPQPPVAERFSVPEETESASSPVSPVQQNPAQMENAAPVQSAPEQQSQPSAQAPVDTYIPAQYQSEHNQQVPQLIEPPQGYQFVPAPFREPAETPTGQNLPPKPQKPAKKARKPKVAKVPRVKKQKAPKPARAPKGVAVASGSVLSTPDEGAGSGKFSRRGLLIGAGAAAVVLAAGGITAANMLGGNSKDSEDAGNGLTDKQVEATDETKNSIIGYNGTPTFTIPISEAAKVYASNAGIAVQDGKKLTLYSGSDGKKIRETTLDGELSLMKETTVGEEAALIWRVGDKLMAFVPSMGSKKDLISVDLPSSAKIVDSGERVMILDGQKVSELTASGKKKYTTVDNLTPISIDKEGLINGGYDTPVIISDSKGKTVRSVTLKDPAENTGLHTWIYAGHGLAVSLWATDAQTSDSQAPVSFVVHKLDTGEVATKIDTTLGDAQGRAITLGQGAKELAWGSVIINVERGTVISELPDGFAPVKVKGRHVIAANASDEQYVFSSDKPGYKYAGSILAETSYGMIAQKGNSIVSYPSIVS